ncbi:MAG TPA: GNAT family N-acetyltransferase [Symbiobacteriaceae bacterium]|nr:GNAT family N-acetyltransferase [Symbiobacteriaceae bacterium]
MLVMVPATMADQAFCFEVFASTRRAALAALHKEYHDREDYYRRRCPNAEHVILVDRGARAGTAIICRRPQEIRLMDLAILPAFRDQGIGTALIRALQAEAGSKHLSLSLQVMRTNRARLLYERLGFVKTGETPTHLSMVWRQ